LIIVDHELHTTIKVKVDRQYCALWIAALRTGQNFHIPVFVFSPEGAQEVQLPCGAVRRFAGGELARGE